MTKNNTIENSMLADLYLNGCGSLSEIAKRNSLTLRVTTALINTALAKQTVRQISIQEQIEHLDEVDMLKDVDVAQLELLYAFDADENILI